MFHSPQCNKEIKTVDWPSSLASNINKDSQDLKNEPLKVCQVDGLLHLSVFEIYIQQFHKKKKADNRAEYY